MSEVARWSFAASGNGTAAVMRQLRPMELVAYGTWGSGTLTLQFSPDGGTTWITVSGVSLTANGYVGNIIASQGDQVRAVLTGATSPSLTVILREVQN